MAIFDKSSKLHSGSGPLKLKFQPGIFAAPGRLSDRKADAGVAPVVAPVRKISAGAGGSVPVAATADAGKGGRS